MLGQRDPVLQSWAILPGPMGSCYFILRTFAILPSQKKLNKHIYILTDHTEFVHFLMQNSACATLLTPKLLSNCSRHLQAHG